MSKSPHPWGPIGPTSLIFHDVVLSAREGDVSGFRGAGPAHYKLTECDFSEALAAVEKRVGSAPWVARHPEGYQHLPRATGRPDSVVLECIGSSAASRAGHWALHFDDGGASALRIADLLEPRGWRAHFHIVSSLVGTEGFANAQDIRELHARGHSIGSHSASHPDPMSACSPEVLMREWTTSKRVLSELIGADVTVASVPGGSYCRAIGEAAAQAGYQLLFNSEPTRRVTWVDDCAVLGRFSVVRSTTAATIAAIAARDRMPIARQRVLWDTKKLAKKLAGAQYYAFRRAVLARRGA